MKQQSKLCLAIALALSTAISAQADPIEVTYNSASSEWNPNNNTFNFASSLVPTNTTTTHQAYKVTIKGGDKANISSAKQILLGNSTSSKKYVGQWLILDGPIGVITADGTQAFRASGINSSGNIGRTYQSIQFSDIDEINITPTGNINSLSTVAVGAFVSNGEGGYQYVAKDASNDYSSSTPVYNEPKEKGHIGKLTTSMPGLGVGIVATAVGVHQKILADIDSIGTKDRPMEVGVYASFPETNPRNTSGGSQYVGQVGEIWASTGGIVNAQGTGFSTQVIEAVGSIVVDSNGATKPQPVIAGIAAESNSINVVLPANEPALSTEGQKVTVLKSIKVDGPVFAPASIAAFYSPITFRSNEKAPVFRAGILNRGGSQLVEFNPDGNDYAEISVGKTNTDGVNYAVLIYPFFSCTTDAFNGSSTYAGYASTETTTELRGSVEVTSGNVSVFGPQSRSSFQTKKLLRTGNVTLKLQSSTTSRGRLSLEENSNLWVTDKSFDTNESKIVHAKYLGSEDETAPIPLFSLVAGSGNSSDDAYSITLHGKNNFVYIDGNFSGNSTINFGSDWNNEDKTISVHSNPVVIKNIVTQANGESTHLNLNVNLSSALPASERDSFLDSKNTNIKVLMKQAVNNLLIANGVDNLSPGGLIVAGEQLDINNFSETGKNLALKKPEQGVSTRIAAGYVTVTTPEGLISPQKTFISKYYLDNASATGTEMETVVLRLIGEVENAAAQLHGENIARALAEGEDSAAEETKEYVKGNGAIFSEEVLPETASSTLSNSDDNSSNTSGSENNQGGNSITTVEGKTSTMASLESVGMSNYFVWREDVETLSQRVGEVRMTPELEGMWVRVIGGKNKYDRSFDYFSNKFYGIQLGVDRNIGSDFGWTVGAAFSYIDGDAKLANGGKDDNYLGSFSLYATKQFENAGYLDLIAKFSRMHNDFAAVSNDRVYFSKGKYSTNAFQLGVEYGKKFALGQNWFIDPQVQLTYGHINKVSYKTDTGVNAKVKGINSLIGRVGVASGYQNDKLSTFVKVDALRDFTAKYKADYQVGNVRNHNTESLKDTWGEISAGTTVNFGKNVKGYAQIKRSFATKVKQEYRADVGLRLVF